MVQDLLKKKLLIGKSRQEVQEILGKPDTIDADAYGYKVMANSGCYFWNCEITILFNTSSDSVDSVDVED